MQPCEDQPCLKSRTGDIVARVPLKLTGPQQAKSLLPSPSLFISSQEQKISYRAWVAGLVPGRGAYERQAIALSLPLFLARSGWQRPGVRPALNSRCSLC